MRTVWKAEDRFSALLFAAHFDAQRGHRAAAIIGLHKKIGRVFLVQVELPAAALKKRAVLREGFGAIAVFPENRTEIGQSAAACLHLAVVHGKHKNGRARGMKDHGIISPFENLR